MTLLPPPPCPHYTLVVCKRRMCQHCRKFRPATDVAWSDGLWVCDDAHSDACFEAAQARAEREERAALVKWLKRRRVVS